MHDLPEDLRTDRRRFSIVTLVFATALLAWGAFVTSIDAGLAVPDWPTSFRSYDPFNPWPNWWKVTPILAEHGHRLLGALVGLFTVVLAFWTWRSDERKWMRRLALGALILVSFQGLLGGLRVIWVSLNLAVVHAMVAQIYYSLLATMILFVSPTWQRATEGAQDDAYRSLLSVTIKASIAVYVQIILGALLRHPGVGIHPLLSGLHLGFAFVAAGAVFYTWLTVRFKHEDLKDVLRLSNWSLLILIIQITLGLLAYFVLLDEHGIIRPSNIQVIVNSSHLVTGALLFASTVTLSVLVYRLNGKWSAKSSSTSNQPI